MLTVPFLLVFIVTIVALSATTLTILNNYSKDVQEKYGNVIVLLFSGLGWITASALLKEDTINIKSASSIVIFALITAVLPKAINNFNEVIKQVNYTIVSTLAVISLPDGLIFQGFFVPLVDKLISILLLLWFLNITSMMGRFKGIDIVQTLCICSGLLLTSAQIFTVDSKMELYSASIVASVLGFVLFNNSFNIRGFGESINAAIGLMIGWMLLYAAAMGHWGIALILPMYYFIDTMVAVAKSTLNMAIHKIKKQPGNPEDFIFVCEIALQKGAIDILVLRYIAKINGLLVLLSLMAAIAKEQISVSVIAVILCSYALGALLHADDPEYGRNKSFKELFKQTSEDIKTCAEDAKKIMAGIQEKVTSNNESNNEK